MKLQAKMTDKKGKLNNRDKYDKQTMNKFKKRKMKERMEKRSLQ